MNQVVVGSIPRNKCSLMPWSERYISCCMCVHVSVCVCCELIVICICVGMEVGGVGHACVRHEAYYFYSQQKQ